MTNRFEVPPEQLAWRCDLTFLPFTCTADMTPLEDFIGQDRAIRAIEFGLGVNKPGFNIFVTGLTGTVLKFPSRNLSPLTDIGTVELIVSVPMNSAGNISVAHCSIVKAGRDSTKNIMASCR